MIELYVGAPGSYKSYHATELGVQKINQYRKNHVIANYPIKPKKRGKDRGEWLYLPNDELTPQRLVLRSIEKGYYGKESSCLLIIDEAGIFFNSRDWQIQGAQRKEWIKFFALSRHYGYDVILIAQEERMLDRQIRSMAEFKVKHVNVRNNFWFKLLLFWIPLKMFVYVSLWNGGSFKGVPSPGYLKFWIANRYDTIRAFDPSPEMIEYAREHGIDIGSDSSAPGEQEGLGVPSADTVQENRKNRKDGFFGWIRKSFKKGA